MSERGRRLLRTFRNNGRGNSSERFGSISLLIRPIYRRIARSSSFQHAAAARIAAKENGTAQQVTTQMLCVVVGGTVFLFDWVEILPMTSGWIYSSPTVFHRSVRSSGTWRDLPRAFWNHVTSAPANSLSMLECTAHLQGQLMRCVEMICTYIQYTEL